MPPATTPRPDREDRLRAEQIRLLFQSGPVGIVAAMFGAFMLAGMIWYLGRTPLPLLGGWLTVVTVDVALHLLLARRYARKAGEITDWRKWAVGFTAFSAVEGLIWGGTAPYLMTRATLDELLLVLLIVCAVTAGAVSAFGIYLPAFCAVFFGAAVPFAIMGVAEGRYVGNIVAVLVVSYIAAMLFVALRHNRDLNEMLRLRFENADLAAELRVQKDAAVAASLAKTRFLAAASHDLRQPVHALGLFVGALRACRLEAEPARLVNLIEDSVSAMDGLFGALLDISRLDAGIVTPARHDFPIQPLLGRLQRDYAADAAAKGLRFRVRPCSATINSDPVLLERVLRNLVSNAVRYTDRGGILVGCRLGKSLRIEVWDTGRGIPAAQAEHVFEEFFQLQNPERDRAQGLGLGLAIVRRLAALLDHAVSLSSRPESGSVFSVTVPVHAAGLQRAPAPSPGGARHGFVLVVDDEIAIQDGMRSLLGSWGHRVVCAGSGDGMLGKVAQEPGRPDLIICDYRLRGDETGVQVIDRLRTEYNHDIPALLITGDTAPDRLAEASGSGLLLLHKPVANSRLRAAVNNLMRRG